MMQFAVRRATPRRVCDVTGAATPETAIDDTVKRRLQIKIPSPHRAERTVKFLTFPQSESIDKRGLLSIPLAF